jgi:hypothetical protein
MPRPVSDPIRRVIWQRWQSGPTAAPIAEALSLPPRTMRHLVQRFRRQGASALRPGYHGAAAAPEGDLVLQTALALRRQHPRWGAPLIRSFLRRDHPDRAIPVARTIPRWFRRHGAARPPHSESPEPLRHRAERPHDVWQMDASERIRLAHGQEVSWLRIVDEYTGAFLLTRVFSLGTVDGRARLGDSRDPAAGVRPLGPAEPHPCG